MMEIANDILKRAAAGDTDAFEEIYKASAGYVLNVAYRILGTREDAEEAAQDVFLIIYRKLKDFRFDASFKTWIYRITVNVSINSAKRSNKIRNRTVEFREELAVFEQANQMREVNKEFHEKVIASLLGVLNPDQRACLVLRSVEKLSYQEIAETLDVNINTVRTRIKRARESLLAIRKEVVNNAM